MTVFDYILIGMWIFILCLLPLSLSGFGLNAWEKAMVDKGYATITLPKFYLLLIIIPLVLAYRLWG